jgi:hypothetical protein
MEETVLCGYAPTIVAFHIGVGWTRAKATEEKKPTMVHRYSRNSDQYQMYPLASGER